MSDKPSTRELERQLRKEPDNLPLRLRLAAAYRGEARAAEAVQLYRSVAVAYHSQRRLAQAIAVCRSVLEIEPGQPETLALLAELEAMKPHDQVDTSAGMTIPAGAGVASDGMMGYAPANHAGPHGSGDPFSGPVSGPATPPPTPPPRRNPTQPPPFSTAAGAAARAPTSTSTPRAGVRVLDQEVAVRDLAPVPRPAPSATPRPVMVPTTMPRRTVARLAEPAPPPAPALDDRRSTGQMTPTPLPIPMPYHEADADSMVEITAPAQLPMAVRHGTEDAETRIDQRTASRVGAAPARPAARSGAPADDDAETRVARDVAWPEGGAERRKSLTRDRLDRDTVPKPMGPMSSGGVDVSADLDTRRIERLDPHDLELLGAAPLPDLAHDLVGDPANDLASDPSDPASDPVHDPASDPVGADAEQRGDTASDDRTGFVDEDTTNPPGALPAGLAPPPTRSDATDANDAVDVEADGTDAGTQWPDEATDTHVRLDAEPPTGLGDAQPSRLFDRPFSETLQNLGPDGTALEGPIAGPLGVFSTLPEHALLELERQMLVRPFAPGAVVLREGERGDSCFVIGSGEVRVLKSDPLGTGEIGGEAIEVARLGEGSLFGEFALLADRRRHATVEAVTACELYEIPRRVLRELAATYPEVGPALERFYRERLLATLLATAPFFQPLPEEQRATLLSRFVPLHAESGQHLVREGERSGGLFLVVLGAVDIVKRVERRTVLLATLREGAYFGEMSLLTGDAASASVTAAGPVELAVLPPRDFYKIVSDLPALWAHMRREASTRKLENAKIIAGDTPGV